LIVFAGRLGGVGHRVVVGVGVGVVGGDGGVVLVLDGDGMTRLLLFLALVVVCIGSSRGRARRQLNMQDSRNLRRSIDSIMTTMNIGVTVLILTIGQRERLRVVVGFGVGGVARRGFWQRRGRGRGRSRGSGGRSRSRKRRSTNGFGWLEIAIDEVSDMNLDLRCAIVSHGEIQVMGDLLFGVFLVAARQEEGH